MQIQVTQTDIDEGIRKDCHYCPVAAAIRRVLQVPYYARVDGTEITIHKPLTDPLFRFRCPSSVYEFIQYFDSPVAEVRAAAVPFTFELDIPESCRR